MTAQGARVRGRLPLADVTELEFEGRLLLAHPGRQVLLVLNETARLVWNSLSTGAPPIATASMLAAAFGIPLEQARREVEAVLSQWCEWLGPSLADDGEPAPVTAPDPDVGVFRSRTYAPCGPPIGIAFGDLELEHAIHPLLALL